MHVVATAGHVDHGKSTLVEALTGTDPDRLVEERARGLTIDLGFAHMVLPSGRPVDLVDVPGHVRFLRNMLAGVGAVDACLFVVAANEGWMPQSEEHLRITELLGVTAGLVALTKVALVDEDTAMLARWDVADRVAGSFLEGAPVVETDAPTGRGLAELSTALDQLLATTPRSPDLSRPRLWVDRSFAAAGAGTVVTGTLSGGAIDVDDELVVMGPGPAAGRHVRVRSLQTHGQSRSSAGPGRRLALNLVGVGHRDVRRGMALVREGQWHRTGVVDASLRALDALDHPVSGRGAYKVHLGSGEYPARLQVLGGGEIPAGGQGWVRLRLPVELPMLPGDRFVLRESGRAETVGGGEVLDVDPVLPGSRARPSRSPWRVVAERGWVAADELERLTGERLAPTVGERWVVDPSLLVAVREELNRRVEQAGPLGLDLANLDERRRSVLAHMEGGVVIRAGRAYPAGTPDGVPRELAEHPWLAALEARPWSPPSPDEVDAEPAVVRELVRRGLVVARDGVYFHPGAVEEAGRAVARLLEATPSGVTVTTVREALGTTRKYVLPLLAELDATGVTRRRGDLRLGGPRLPPPGHEGRPSPDRPGD